MSRRWTNDQWLGRSLKQAGQTLIAPSARHVSVVLPFEGESSTTLLTIFLACILYCPFLYGSNGDGDMPSVALPIFQEVTRDRGSVAPLGMSPKRAQKAQKNCIRTV